MGSCFFPSLNLHNWPGPNLPGTERAHKKCSIRYMHAPRSIQMNYSIFVSILCFLFTLSIVLIHSHDLHFHYIVFYFIFHYLCLYSQRGTLHLLPLWGYMCALTFLRLHVRTDILVGANSLATQWAFASARRDLFASATPMHLLPLDTGLSNAFPHIVGRVETWAAYDLIGKSWPMQYSFPLLSAWPPLRRWALVHF